MISILIVQRDIRYLNELANSFEEEHYEVRKAQNIAQAVDVFNKYEFEICLIDMVFEDGSGTDLKTALNAIKDIPTIVVTDIDEDIQKVLALEYGCDDYVVRPFNILELKSRIRAVLRRYNVGASKLKEEQNASGTMVFDDFELNVIGRRALYHGEDLDLTGKEYDLLYVLISNPQKVFSRAELAETVWGEDHNAHLRTVDVHIRRLREKLMNSNPDEELCIKTKWGEGYYYGESLD